MDVQHTHHLQHIKEEMHQATIPHPSEAAQEIERKRTDHNLENTLYFTSENDHIFMLPPGCFS